ncbi:M14 family zinc carboxypeptidase [Salinisphaera orenii]|nr:M14 family zinc carboxypeptidase [Salinisphaera orenii]
MGKRWFRTGNEIKSMHGMGRRPGLLALGWLASLVLVAAVAVMLTERWSTPPGGDAGDDRIADAQRTPGSEQTGGAASSADAERDAPAAESADTRIVEAPASAGTAGAPAADDRAESARDGDDDADQTSDRRVAASGDGGPEAPEIIPVPAADGVDKAASGDGGRKGEGELANALSREGALGLVETARLSPPPRSQAVVDWCRQLDARVVGVSSPECMSDAYRDTGGRSVEGRPLIMREIAASSGPAAGRVLLISATHGDEPSSIGTVFGWMELMAEEGTRYDWHVAPTLNPDGVFHEPATRLNANGVDLNRNLPTPDWHEKSRAYWRRVGFEKRRYPGENPGGEPENEWLVEQIRSFRPDVIISLHAPYGVLDYDGDFPAPRKLGRLDLNQLGVYPGSLGNFGARMNSIPVITVELDHARKPPGDAELKRMWRDLNGWLDRYFSSVRQARADNAADSNDAG